ncbi:MAG: hypothetical protein Q4B67_04810 [Eubacteriales bacterium]|nr:hypothetical protein [Eubacteriales bacterium]
MEELEFRQKCSELNERLRSMQDGVETVTTDIAARSMIIVKNMKIDGIGDAFLYASALNVLNTFVKQDKDAKKEIGYFFKRNTEALARWLIKSEDKGLRLEIQSDQGMSLLVAEIYGVQFSFHQVTFTEKDMRFLTKDNEHPEIPWDGIRKQRTANTLFEFAFENTYGRTNKMMDGSDFLTGLNALMDNFHNGALTLPQLKKKFFFGSTKEEEDEDDKPVTKLRVAATSDMQKEYPFRARPSACLYEGKLSNFLLEIEERELVEFLVNTYREGYGIEVLPTRQLEWKYAFEILYNILRDSGADGESGVRIENVYLKQNEYTVVIFTGHNKAEHKIHASMVQLLGWERMHLNEDEKDGDMVYEYSTGEAEESLTVHPAIQMIRFNDYFTHGILDEQRFDIDNAVFFYDAVKSDDNDIESGFNPKTLSFVTMCYANEREKLRDFIMNSVSLGGASVALHALKELFDISDFSETKNNSPEDYNYLKLIIEKEIKAEKKFLAIIDARAKTGKTTAAGGILRMCEKSGIKACLVTEHDEKAADKVDIALVVYDNVIPETIDYEKHPYNVIFFDPYTKTSGEKNVIQELRYNAEVNNVNVRKFTLQTAFGYSDYGAGNNWLIRHFAIALIPGQEWKPNLYSIDVVDSFEGLKEEKGIANILVPKTIRCDETGTKIICNTTDRINLYKDICRGSNGVRLVIEDPALKEKISRELSVSKNRYGWIERLMTDFNGNPEKMVEAQKELFENSVIRRKYETKVIDCLGQNAWNKLSEESRTWILSAMLSFNDIKNYDKLLDFSGVVVQICKAIESEFQSVMKRYFDWLKNKYGDDILDNVSNELIERSYGKKRLKDVTKFTIGTMSYIMGIDNRGKVVCEKDYEEFTEFAMDVLLNEECKKDPEKCLKYIAKTLEVIRSKYRNKAAHSDSIDIVVAQNCIEYCITVERKIGVIMDMFA